MNLRYGSIALAIVALAACSTSGNNSNISNPLSGVTIIAAPSATPTPVVTPSPTPAPSSTQAIADGGFESGGFTAGWTACSIPHVAPSSTASPGAVVPAGSIGAFVVSATSPTFAVAASPQPENTPSIYAGTYSAFTFSGTGAQTAYGSGGSSVGPAGNNGVCQTFTVPTDGVLTFYVNEGGSDTGLNYADQQADLISSSGADTNLFFELNDPNNAGTGGATAGGSWVQKGPYALTSAPYNLTPGSSVELFIGSYDSSPGKKYGVYMFVDNVSVVGTTVQANARHRSSVTKPVSSKPNT